LQRAATGSSTEPPQPLSANVTASANGANGEDFVPENTRYLAPSIAAAATTSKPAADTATHRIPCLATGTRSAAERAELLTLSPACDRAPLRRCATASRDNRGGPVGVAAFNCIEKPEVVS